MSKRTEFNDETLEFINRRNFENFIMMNRELVRYFRARTLGIDAPQVYRELKYTAQLAKVLRRGKELGVLRQVKPRGNYYLSEEAIIYYDELLARRM